MGAGGIGYRNQGCRSFGDDWQQMIRKVMTMNGKLKLVGLAALGALLLTGTGAYALEGEGSVAQTQKENNDRIIAIQHYGGLRKSTGEVTVTYYGSSAFKVTSPRGVEVFIDPWRNDPTGVWGIWYQMDLPITTADIAVITHAHFDHDAYNRLRAAMILDRMSGTFELGDVKVIGIAEKHVCVPQGKYSYRAAIINLIHEDPCEPTDTMQWDNTLFVIETGGLRFLVWGDNRQNPPQDVWDRVGNIDVAFLAVSDDGHILSPHWTDVVAQKMNAKVVIPCHYAVKGINVPGAGGVESADKWVMSHEHKIFNSATTTFTPDSVKGMKQFVVYFGGHVPFPVSGPPKPDTTNPQVPDPVNAWERFKN